MRIHSDLNALYLEDETLIALDGEEALREIGISSLHTARTLDKANAIAKEYDLDLAVLDVNLGGGKNSFGLARELIDSGANVVFISGYNADEFPEDLRNVPIISKPFDADRLSNVICNM